jgi:hypothetical protein
MGMKLIIAGSRTLHPSPVLIKEMMGYYGLLNVTEYVCGGANGVDASGRKHQEFEMLSCQAANVKPPKLKLFPADWVKHGRAAGPIRNMEMAAYADALLLIWDGQSRGSANMKQCMINKGKPVYEVILSRTKN